GGRNCRGFAAQRTQGGTPPARMKTITEYQPMIYSRLGAAAEKRSWLRRQVRADMLMALGYCGVGLWLGYDTGFMIWEWQFWIMFAPILFAGELASRAISKGD